MATGIFGAYCQHCGYSLEGLIENRCPECGRAFDPSDGGTYDSDPTARRRRRRSRFVRAVALPLLLIPIMWLVLPIPFVGSIAAISGAITAGYLVWKKRWFVAVAVAIGSPLTVYFGMGVVDYVSATGVLRYSGLPSTESFNIDPEYRCERSSSGCLVDGNEWIYQGAYNLALTTLIKVFGPMRGSYVGAYPSKAECLAALQSAQTLELEDLLADKIPIVGQEVRLDAGVGSGLIGRSSWQLVASDSQFRITAVEQLDPLQAVYVCGVLLLRISELPRGLYGPEKSGMVVLIDPVSGRPFAYYGLGDYYHRFPPVRWRR